MDENKTDENDDLRINEETIIERNHSTPRNKGRFFIIFLIGIVIGLVVMFFINDNQTEEVEQKKSTTKNESINVDITTQITEIVEEVTPAVVGITNVQTSDEFWRQENNQSAEAGTGSGVIYKKEGNKAFIITNHHVIENADSLEVILSNEITLEAELLGSDLFMDLAVLQVEADEIKDVVKIGSSESIKVGEPVIAIGNPLGHMFSGSVTQGIISGKKRNIPQDFNQDGQADWQAEVIQTDAAINPGNSGGALIDIEGKLIGINSMKINEEAVEGIGFAIPIDTAWPIVQELERTGKVTRPFLGVEIYSLGEVPQSEWGDTLTLPDEVEGGVYIWSIEPLSPASDAGLERLDVITELDGKQVTNMIDLRKILYQEKEVGDTVRVTYYRDG
ncbi:MAG TPA: trypsin-like peptidase domain-containing protein, partial [Pseudogracilibacillus sp.]|nr:trypsin-like peptidase domain-containing protein [Pseudogracilibacillus sp.]